MINLDYPNILDLCKRHLAPKRTESASFLIWYLENYYRLDSLEAIDSVCDQRGDKGVDGIYVNDNDNTIDIFQCKLSQSKESTIGDTALKEFYGTLSQFKSQASVQNLIDSGGEAHVVRLIKRLDLVNKVGTYEIRGIFISNTDLDSNGDSYLKVTPLITFIGKSKLGETYIADERPTSIPSSAKFDISGFTVSQYIVDTKTKAMIAPVKAKELVKLKGIADQSLFAFNVRGPLGRTQVNKDIENSIKNPSTHKLFPLFHNGITIICGSIKDTPDKITIEDYYVVNGCQSLNSLYDNQARLTDGLRILTKFVQVDVSSGLSRNITWYSNNQNGIKPRDSKSNNPIQIRLQNEFQASYRGQYWFEIKRGEKGGTGEVISNEEAGLYLMSFDLKEPWATHRKYQVFEDKYADLFCRPEVSADRIIMCCVMMKAITSSTEKIENKLFGKYALTERAMLYMLRCILENDSLGRELIANPSPYVKSEKDREYFATCISRIVNDIVVDLNAEVKELGPDFDYRGKLRDPDWVKNLSKDVVSSYLKLVQRDRIPSFESEWRNRTKLRPRQSS